MCFNFPSADDDLGHDENVVENVQTRMEVDNGVNVMEDLTLDEFNTEDMEALDAVEENALKTDIKVQ